MVLTNYTTRSAFRNIKLIFQMVDRLAFGERGLELSLDKLFDNLLVEYRQATYCFFANYSYRICAQGLFVRRFRGFCLSGVDCDRWGN